MPCYLISYDQHAPGNHEKLTQTIKGYGTWARILESTWAVVTEDPATKVRDSLQSYLENSEGLVVMQSSGVAAWAGVFPDVSEWLKAAL